MEGTTIGQLLFHSIGSKLTLYGEAPGNHYVNSSMSMITINMDIHVLQVYSLANTTTHLHWFLYAMVLLF